MEQELTCIGCPMGCNLIIRTIDGDLIISGNSCPRGEEYAKKELTNPTRILTTTIPVMNGKINCVSVKTASDIPKNAIMKCVEELKGIAIEAPVKIGDVVVKNIGNTGIEIVATKNVQCK